MYKYDSENWQRCASNKTNYTLMAKVFMIPSLHPNLHYSKHTYVDVQYSINTNQPMVKE